MSRRERVHSDSALRRIRAWWVAMLCLAVLSFGLAASAQSQGATEVEHSHAARDMFRSRGEHLLDVPPVPADYIKRTLGALRVSYPASLEPVLHNVLAHVEQDFRSLEHQFGLTNTAPLDVRLVPSPDVMRALAPGQAPPPAYAVGVAYPRERLTLVSATAPRTHAASDVRRVLRHELSHLLLGYATGDAALPRWFSEGVAVEQAAEHSFERFEQLARASATNSLLPLRTLDSAFSGGSDEVDLAYAQAADFVGHLLRRDGPTRLGVFASHLRGGASFEQGLQRTWGFSLIAAESAWREDVKQRHLFLPFLTGAGVFWGIGALLLVVAWARSRRRAVATMARWKREDEAAERLREEQMLAERLEQERLFRSYVSIASAPTDVHLN
ncbi:MAG: peptidase MA family metallohydrolase [Deltaproteobacteria bacterium]|nr:peptidase MA family metallohydrolase [Deltaproteobacteria bacterium]